MTTLETPAFHENDSPATAAGAHAKTSADCFKKPRRETCWIIAIVASASLNTYSWPTTELNRIAGEKRPCKPIQSRAAPSCGQRRPLPGRRELLSARPVHARQNGPSSTPPSMPPGRLGLRL